MTPEDGRREGQRRKRLAMELTAIHHDERIKRGQIAMLTAALERDERTCTSDDIPDDIGEEYSNGGWAGAAVHGLVLARIIKRIGNQKSARPSRKGNEVKLWRVVDDERAAMFIEDLRTCLGRKPLPAPAPAAIPASLFGEDRP